jgi:hypothetical protein
MWVLKCSLSDELSNVLVEVIADREVKRAGWIRV